MPIFLFTDIEGSTKKWEKYPEQMKTILSQHDAIIKENIEKYGGKVIKHTGDGVFAVFERGKPLQGALEIQKQIAKTDWREIGELRIRIGLHAGYAEKKGDDYFGPVINRTARVMAAAWGGQIILTPEVKNSTDLPEKASLKDLGAHLLKDLGEPQRIYELVHPDFLIKDFPPLRSLSSHPNNLPIHTTPFLDRETELADITKVLGDASCRLLTLIGPGGIGKTRLAIQAAAEQIEHFSDGVYFVPLDPLSSADFLISTIAEALKFSFYSSEDEKTQLLNYLHEKEMLIILDNFEHVVEGAGLIGEIMNVSPQVKLVITSRELLNLKGEWIVQISGMKVPEGEGIDIEGYSAVQLFFYNARRINTNIKFSEEEKRSVVRICQLVGGLPLGIELASAWLRTLSCRDIAQEIEENLDFLTTSMRDIPERHRSLRAVFDYSWNLISDQEKTVLQKLSVFCGEFSRDAAEKVAGASLPILASLVDKSLLRRTLSGRYELLDILKNYTLQKLTELPDEKERVRDLHCQYYADFLNQREKDIVGPKHKAIIEDITAEIENIRAAWQWAVEHNKITELEKLLDGIFQFHSKRSLFQEGKELLKNALDMFGKDRKGKVYAKILADYAWFLIVLGDLNEAKRLLDESLSVFRSLETDKEIAETLNNLGQLNRIRGQYKDARQYHEESLKMFRKLNDQPGIAATLNLLSYVYEGMGEYETALKFTREGFKLWQEIEDKIGISNALNILGMIAHGMGKYKESKEYYLESLEISKELRNKMGIGRSLNNIANIVAIMGDRAKAKQYYQEGADIFREMGNLRGVSTTLSNLGIIARLDGNNDEGWRLHEKSLKISEKIGHKTGIVAALSNLSETARNMGELNKSEKLQRRALTIAQKMGDYWYIETSYNNLASISFRLGKYKEAFNYYRDALKTAIEKSHPPMAINAISGVAMIWAKQGREKDALELAAFIMQHPASMEDVKKEIEALVKEINEVLSKDEVAAIQENAEQKKLENLAAMILENKAETK
jgi:predicted ATPase